MSIVEKALQLMHAAGKGSSDAGSSSRESLRPVVQPVPVSRRAADFEINRTALRAAELLPQPAQERRLSDQYRRIKRPLLAQAFGAIPNGHVIMMASALPGEGKTFCSINLAFSMAREKDIEVVLIDADVAKPRMSTVLHLNERPGLLDVLQDESLDVDSLLLQTDVPSLTFLPAGGASENATELLASARMQRLVARLSARSPKCIVLIDSPPLLLTSESVALSAVVGQVVLVVKAGATPQRSVLDALDLLGEAKPVSLLLNQSESTTTTGDYYGTPYSSYG